jgi:hypothetical protein
MDPANERVFAALVFLGICALAIYRTMVWVMEAKRTADPWSADVDEALDREGALPLCHHCLTPQEHSGWFCPNCGATVGPYSNYLPYIYLFSQGEVLRAGVTERFRRTPLIVLGYFLISLGFFALVAPLVFLWAPFYWFSLAGNLLRPEQAGEEPPPVIH